MYKELIINITDNETRVALIEEGTIAELFIGRDDDLNITGNIYKGRVQRVLPGMQAAFVDIGLEQAAFIYVDDVIEDSYSEFKQRLIDSEGNENIKDIDAEGITGSCMHRNSRIEELITEGQEIMVQVSKSPIGNKGARVTSNSSLPGRFLVLMPTVNHIGISRRIEDEDERIRLKNMIHDLKKEKFGYIVRTAGEYIQEDKFAKEMELLVNLWEKTQKKYDVTTAPSLLHRELTITLRAVRDILTNEADKIVVDSRQGYEAIVSFIEEVMPGLKDSVELYEGTEPIFEAFNLEGDISRALKKKVWLKSGGYIVIEQTEALVAIDVNTGRYVGKHNFEETILKTNLEAVKEIAYQIRLRNIGGIIIIDLIDMEKKSNQEKVVNTLKEALKRDRRKTKVLSMSDIGLVQMTRQRTRKSLARMMCEPCFYCDGEGYLMSRQSICYNIYREMLRQAQDMTGNNFTIKVNPKIAELLHGEENKIIVSLEQILNKKIEIYPNPQFHIEEFEIFELLQG